MTSITALTLDPILMLDFSKAFDKVFHRKSCYKLSAHYGINGKLFHWIKDYLTDHLHVQSVLLEAKSTLSFQECLRVKS